VIDVAATPADATAAQPAPAPATVEPPPALGPPSSPIRTVAIDPGHGGGDDGVRSAGGTKEKDLTLSVARRAKGAIEGRLGIRVIASSSCGSWRRRGTFNSR